MTGSELVDPDRLSRYLTGRIDGFERLDGVLKTATGQSNPTFVLTTNVGRLVLRRKPPGNLLKSAHAIEREYQVMRALADTAVPVPRMYLLCEDEEVIGAPFFVMAHVDGQTENDPRCPNLLREVRERVYDQMNASLAALHSVDAVQIGLERFGRPDNYFARQLERWTKQYRASQTDDLPGMEDLIAWLGQNLPAEDGTSSLVHGDWRLDNLLFDPQTGQITAVLDWELSTRGHPLADVAAQLMQWQMPVGPVGRGLDGVDRQVLGIPTDEAYLALYATRAGLSDVPDMRFPITFAFFRMAAILQGVKRRALDGNASNPDAGLAMGKQIPVLVKKAQTHITGAG